MEVSSVFSLGNLLQIAGLGLLLYVIQQSYQTTTPSTRQQQPNSSLPELPQQPSQASKSKKDKNKASQHDSTPQPDEKEDESIMREVLQDYIGKAEAFKTDLGDKRLTVEHMVLAMAEDPRFAEILQCAEGLDSDNIKKAIRKSRVVFGRGGADEQPADTSVLAKYSRDLTALAAEGKLDPVIGRHGEMRRLIDVLCRRTKNSAVLLGEPGVGKTAIVQGLAQRLAEGDVPEGLREAKMIALELGLLMAGATFPGEFEERLRGVLAELTAAGSKAILFIDDIHGITGPNAQQGGGVMDASVLLKPLLARGEVRVVGCTSQDKYRKFIEKDPGLERRFQTISVEPPGIPETISILRGLRHKYEAHHSVRIPDTALAAAATLADTYLPDRYLPDKAIDLIDEASAKVKTDIALKPEALDRAERRIHQLQKERKLLARTADIDAGAAADLEALDAELARLKASCASMSAALEVETKESERTQRLQDDLDRLDAEIETAEEAGDTAKAEQLRKARRAELVRKIRQLQRRGGGPGGKGGSSSSAGGSGKVNRAEVGEPDVARIISSWTGIPLTKLVESEADKLLNLTDELHKRIVGQDEAVVAVSEAIQRSRAGMKDPNGPIASFLFLGPTGVGKTELAKALAANLFNTEQAMVRLDMSEYMEKHAVAKLIGAPPGYIGFDEGGQLTEQVRRRPYCVILFDEVEKAHVDVFNLLLQILDDGRVTDSQGRVVSFKNAIIIMTSNLGSAEIFNHTYKSQTRPATGGLETDLYELVMDKVRRHFQPEFLNRIDEFIMFEPLNNDQIRTIVQLRTAGVVKRVAEKKLILELTDSAISHLAAVGFDPVYGARPVKRAIQQEIETPLAQALLRGVFQDGDTIIVEAGLSGQGLQYSRIPAPTDPSLEPEDLETEIAAAAAAASASTGNNKSSSQISRQPGLPIPVQLPAPVRRGNSNKRLQQQGGISSSSLDITQQHNAAMRDSSNIGTNSTGDSSSSAKKYDPLKGARKGSKSSSSNIAAAGKHQPLQQNADADNSPPDSSSALTSKDDGNNTTSSHQTGQQQVHHSSSQQQLMSGLDDSIAAQLDADNLPSFLKTPKRRDEQDELPTRSY